MDESDEGSNPRQRSPYLPPAPKSRDDFPEVRVPRASPLPSLSLLAPREASADTPDGEIGQVGRAVLALIVFTVLAAAAYIAFASSA